MVIIFKDFSSLGPNSCCIITFLYSFLKLFIIIMYLVDSRFLKSLELANDHLEIGNLEKKFGLGHHMM